MAYKRTDLKVFDEGIQRCQHCGSDMTHGVSAVSYALNPFCNGCYSERARQYTRATKERHDELAGRYSYFDEQEIRKAG